VELLLRNQESRSYPALTLVAAVPTFHVSANSHPQLKKADSITFVLAKVCRSCIGT
jgi:hypothetical protein